MSIEETRSDFHLLMDEVKSDLLRMGAHVAEGISAVTVALLAGDIDAAAAWPRIPSAPSVPV